MKTYFVKLFCISNNNERDAAEYTLKVIAALDAANLEGVYAISRNGPTNRNELEELILKEFNQRLPKIPQENPK